ncbi:fimbria/pilus outer membrane usher protein [Stenotrophomonas rhizophila]
MSPSLSHRAPHRQRRGGARVSTLAAALAGCWHGLAMASGNGAPVELAFNADFLMDGASDADLERFRHGNPVEAGEYDLDVHLNDSFLGRHGITFHPGADPLRAEACLPRTLLEDGGVKAEHLQEDVRGCVPLVGRVEHAQAHFDTHALRLNLSVPQQALETQARGTVNPGQWDPGVTVGMLDYDFNAQRNDSGVAAYAGLSFGFNHGPWRLRHRGTWRRHEGDSGYQAGHTYLQRDVVRWRSQLLVGQSMTTGELFDSIAFTGAQLSSDEQMLPDALRGYAPLIRGMARSAATVTVRQSGYVIHEIRVAAGPFLIDDLYPSNYGGDLDVVVTEADGSEQRFSVNFAAVPQALRQGAWRYSLAGGRRRTSGEHDGLSDPVFFQGTWGRGMNNWLTLLAGTQATQGYHAALAGAAINTSIGAFGADLTHSQVTLNGHGVRRGNSVRVNYQRHMASTGTNIGLATYRYSSGDFVTLEEAMQWRAKPGDASGQAILQRAKRRIQLDFSQQLGTRSSAFVRASHVSYWGAAQAQTDYQIGLQSRWRRVSWSLSAMRVRSSTGRRDDQFQAQFEVPLGGAERPASVSLSLAQQQGGTSQYVNVSGRAPGSLPVDYGAGLSRSPDGSKSANLSAQLQTPLARVSAGYMYSEHDQRITAGASGAVVWHPGGLNLGPSLGNTFGIVRVDGGKGARVGINGAKVGRNGYALLPGLSPYRWNEVTIASDGLSLDLTLLQNSRRVAPTAGAAVALSFETQQRHAAFAYVTHPDGSALTHFGSQVYDSEGAVVGVVGQGGIVHLHAPINGWLTVGTGTTVHCAMQFSQAEVRRERGQRWAESVCQDSATTAGDDHQPPAAPAPPVTPLIEQAASAADLTVPLITSTGYP